MLPDIPPAPNAPEVSLLWTAVVIGLLSLMLIDLVGIIYTVVSAKDVAVITSLTGLFTTLLAGLLSLFLGASTRS
ncbi:hypothetical protein ACIQUL_29460 [Streptomyces sp. NPDC090303]|uniref:hypothetical protein n=1 Tax=Streptomyces sp. NPDC090303 TaxID=3365960 RepID=UPI003816FF18